MNSLLRNTASSLLLLLLLAGPALAADTIHPYTQQNWDQWQQLLKAADDSMAKKAPADEMVKALEATDAFHSERAQVLKRHPDYPQGLEHQLAVRLSLVKLYTNVGFLYAKTAAEKKNGTLLTKPGGAFARLNQAAATLKAYVEVKGEADPGAQKMNAYVADIRRQVDGVAAQLNAAGVAVAPASSTPVDKGTEAYFRQWWEKLDQTDKAFAAGDAVGSRRAFESARDHQKGWNGWLQKHSEYAKTVARQDALGTKLTAASVQPAIDAALALAKKGFDEKNSNYFSGNSGVDQKLAQARAALAELANAKGAQDPEVERLTQAIASAEKQVAAQGAQLNAEALAGRRMPVDVYGGSDKAGLKAQILAYWKQTFPKDKVLGLRFFETNWTRETNWKENATSYYKSDYSWLPAKVVVQTSDDVATLYPAFANKQHQSGNKVEISSDHGGGAYVVDQMLMKNVKF